ncbi:integrin alpha-8-like [Antedon mediterranea]|uniref:integrin alpha-8-like n=1 Tax=Antedon mediterranea TaxID=105859 RepID=UPI003AF72654
MDRRPVLSARSMERRLFSCILTFIFYITYCNGYNLDTSYPIVHKFDEIGSLFGFSVAQHSVGNTKWLIVGAPNANTTGASVTQNGAVYRCPVTPFSNPGRCTKIDFDNQDSTAPTPNIKDDQWLGASVASSGADGTVVACAPRFVWRHSGSSSTFQDEPVGRCHSVKKNFLEFQSYSPCYETRGSSIGHSGVTHCQAGMAIDIDPMTNRMFLGAPGSFYWQGQGILLDLNVPTTNLGSSQEEALTFDDSYRGYSVAFITLADGRRGYVLGVPRGEDLQGMVQIVIDIQTSNVFNTFPGFQMGSYFGQALAVSDLNGDGFEDLVISAPLYVVTISSQKKWDAGQVYVYYQNAYNQFSTSDILSGSKTKARFGFSLAAVGDTNLDGFNDLAVGAPYDGETGAGLVYIYSGHSGGIRKRNQQIIEPSVVAPGMDLTTFGYSLSGGMDMDDNNYPDVLVGSAYSDAAVLLRSRPIVKLSKVLTTVNPPGINLDVKNTTVNNLNVVGFDVTACFEYKGKFVPGQISIDYTLKLDASQQVSQLKRALFVISGTDYFSAQRTLTDSTENCWRHSAYIKNEIRDKISSMTITTEYQLVEEPAAPSAVAPILSIYSRDPTSSYLYFVNNCPNNVCIPDLELKAVSLKPKIVVGDSDDVVLNVKINNKGQKAYQSTLVVFLPDGLEYSRISNKPNNYKVGCMETSGYSGRIECDVGNPMPENYKLDFDFVLRPTSEEMIGKYNTMTIEMHVTSSNAEPEGTVFNNVVNVTVPVALQFSLSLKGVSKPSQLKLSEDLKVLTEYPKDTPEELVGDEVEHFYEIRNTNESSFGKTELVILFPTKNQDDEHLLYLTSISSDGDPCTVEGGKENELSLKLKNDEKDQERGEERLARQADEPVVEDIMFSCDNMKCVKITCTFSSISGISSTTTGSNKAKISIKSRLWAATFVDYTTSVDLISTANVTVKDSSYAIAKSDDYINLQQMTQVKTTANPVQYLIKSDGPVWWIYVLAIAGGLLLLTLLTLLLWKCGFFKRKKYQSVSQG